MWECVWKKSDVTLFVIVNIFISNCNLITFFFLVTVTNYNYFYFVIKLRNSVTCNLLPNTGSIEYNIRSTEVWLRLYVNTWRVQMQKPLKDILVKN